MKLKILWLYPKNMNIYGDYGNVLTIEKRLKWRGVDSEIIQYNPGDRFPEDADIVLGGGGQDSGQGKIQDDLLIISDSLKKMAEKNIPMLVICGLYQLFGEYFQTVSGEKIKGANLFDGLRTFGGNERMIGNIVEDSTDFGQVIGYENHSGRTVLSPKNKAFSKVILGAGNDLESGFEGVKYKNVIGTYLHGSLLPKNPKIADFLIEKAFENKNEKVPEILDEYKKSFVDLEAITEEARKIAASRPR